MFTLPIRAPDAYGHPRFTEFPWRDRSPSPAACSTWKATEIHDLPAAQGEDRRRREEGPTWLAIVRSLLLDIVFSVVRS